MEFATASDPLLRAATLLGIAAFCLALLLMLTIVALRIALALRQRREQRVIAHCQPLLLRAIEQPLSEIPALSKAERIVVLHLWHRLHESLRGPVLDKLNALAMQCGFDTLAHELLLRRSIPDRLLGIATAGMLRDKRAWDTISRFARGENSVVSLTAARAMLLIDADEALDRLLPDFATRADWPVAGIATMLAEVGPDRITGPLVQAAIRRAGSPDAAKSVPRLLRLLEMAHLSEASAAALSILERAADASIIAAALRLLREPKHLPLLRRYCEHENWTVRVQAAHALGRLGAAEDRMLLVNMLVDSSWWVRYRAAQALAALPFVSLLELKVLRKSATDRFAADMLTQVIAEREAA